MKLETLISTMNINAKLENQKLINKMNIKGNSLTISQTNKNGKEYGKNRIIYVQQKGLSKSRNLAIENADADIILLADDDVIYNENYEKIILEAYKQNPDADMIAFYVKSRNPKRKVRKLKTGRMGWIKAFRVSSFQLSFRLKSIKDRELKFDENFGAGTENFCGEENIFLCDCLKNKMKLLYIDKKIGEVEQSKSTWFKGFNKELILVKKNCYKRIAPKLWWILWVQFIVRKGTYIAIERVLKKANKIDII